MGPPSHYREVVYDEARWRLLEEKRGVARRIMKVLVACGLGDPIVHGSVARGDVDKGSDVDVVLLNPYPPSIVELCLERGGFRVYSRVVVQPTPVHTPKVYIYLDPEGLVSVTLPLSRLRSVEYHFYRFSGFVTLQGIERSLRVPGVNKRLFMVEPRPWGHVEYSIVGNEHVVARVLKVPIEVVKDRVEALTRRDRVGRTGLFVEVEVPPDTPVEQVVEMLCRENRMFREAAPDAC